MVLNLPSVAGKALPITLKEYGRSLASAWNSYPQAPCPTTTLGLAISGGVDSMALASLCSKLQSSDAYDWRFRAFVVDHGARTGSEEEAKAVAAVVEDKDIETKVLKIEWPKDLIPSKSSKFESIARHHRFRILGEACRDFNIRTLLLAHHEDDHFETVLMRLVTGHHGRGLLGIRPSGRIPECYGIYGVYDSGATNKVSSSLRLSEVRMLKEEEDVLSSKYSKESWNTPDQSEQSDEDLDRIETRETVDARFQLGQMRLEDGGIRVLRPLLQYGKERLIATCLEDSTPWFEDHTNADPTLTPRNAIRHLYKHHALPAALQKDRIIALSTSMLQMKSSLEKEALAILDSCVTRDFEPRAGSLFVQFPKMACPQSNLVTEKGRSAMNQTQREVAYEVLKYAIDAVSPYQHSQYRLDHVYNTVFPELSPANNQGKARLDKFTVAGVMFQRKELQHPIKYRDSASKAASIHEQQQHKVTVPMQDCEWFLSRQPHHSILERQPLVEFPPLTSFKDAHDSWKLYDGRYWIRLLNHTRTTLQVRPLRKTDILALKKQNHLLRDRLHALAPGDVRFTLPVIVMPAALPGQDEDKVLAVPSLDVVVPGAEGLVSYEIRYKRVEWPRLRERKQDTTPG